MDKKIKSKIKEIDEGDLILVKWRDIHDTTAWRSSDNPLELALVATTGIFLKEGLSHGRKVIRFAHSVAGDGDRDEMVLPISLIDSIDILNKKNSRR